MDSFDFEEGRKASRKSAEREQGHSKDWAGAEARPGNQAMQRLVPGLRVNLKGAGNADLDQSIARAIQAKRGGGHSLDDGVRKKMEGSFREDFSGVKVHSDSHADSLSRAVKAEAFTTGSDIFFKSGKYNPNTGDGQKLLAHELTHVVQQKNAPPAQGLTVSHPEDASERQAGDVADSVMTKSTGAAVGRQGEEEEEEVATQAAPEEEEEAATSVDRQAAEEEEEEVATQAAPEEEEEGKAPVAT